MMIIGTIATWIGMLILLLLMLWTIVYIFLRLWEEFSRW